MTAKKKSPTAKKPSRTDSAKPVDTRKRIPLRITDTTLRDAHQSLWATRMRTKDIMGIIDTVDAAGYYSLEVWGGATFDVCMRFLRENPWERLRMIKARAKTPLQMLLRGQNILGYKHYPDDLLHRFVELSAKNGIDIFRIFDALNDNRNLEEAVKAVNRVGAHAQGAISYTISPVHTVEAYVKLAQEQVQMGVDSIVIKDMAGILSPIRAEALVSALVKAVKVPIQVHTHMTSGMGVATYVEAVRAGAGAIDCAISVMSCRSSQPPVETMLAIFDEMPYHASMDLEALQKICKYFTELAPHRQLDSDPINPIDPGILLHHIPGGMISNLRSQLVQQDALDRLPEVLEELPRCRADMGYPPLVTPTSQIVGVQAVLNVLAGERYAMLTEETRNVVKGLYGRPPAPINPTLLRKVMGRKKPMTKRPADALAPMLPTAASKIDPALIHAEEDIISYCLFPEQAQEYFRWRALPTEERPTPPVELERRKEDAPAPPPPEPARPFLTDYDYRELNALADKVAALQLNEFTIRRNDLNLSLRAGGIQTGPAVASAPAASAAAAAVPESVPPTDPVPTPETKGITIDAPLTGTFYRSSGPGETLLCEPGDTVKSGEAVCIVEAMKLFNQIKAPQDCRILDILAEHGDSIKKGQPMIRIEPL